MVTCTPHGASKDISGEYVVPLHGKKRVWVSGRQRRAQAGNTRERLSTCCEATLTNSGNSMSQMDVKTGPSGMIEGEGGDASGSVEGGRLCPAGPMAGIYSNRERASYGNEVADRRHSSGWHGGAHQWSRGVMKSWLGLDWALAVAEGRAWLGREVSAVVRFMWMPRCRSTCSPSAFGTWVLSTAQCDFLARAWG